MRGIVLSGIAVVSVIGSVLAFALAGGERGGGAVPVVTASQPDLHFLAFDFIERYGKFDQGSRGIGEFLHEGGVNPTPVDQAPKYKALVRSQR